MTGEIPDAASAVNKLTFILMILLQKRKNALDKKVSGVIKSDEKL